MINHKCSYCKRELRGRYWINYAMFNQPQKAQCDRWWCRLLSGHLLWWHFKLKPVWKPKQVSFRVPSWPFFRKT